MEGLNCQRVVGCHACALPALEEKLRMLRAELVQLIVVVPLKEERTQKIARSVIQEISIWITPEKEG